MLQYIEQLQVVSCCIKVSWARAFLIMEKRKFGTPGIQELRIPLETVELQLTIHSTVTTVSGLLVPSDLTGFAQACTSAVALLRTG